MLATVLRDGEYESVDNMIYYGRPFVEAVFAAVPPRGGASWLARASRVGRGGRP